MDGNLLVLFVGKGGKFYISVGWHLANVCDMFQLAVLIRRMVDLLESRGVRWLPSSGKLMVWLSVQDFVHVYTLLFDQFLPNNNFIDISLQ